MKHADTRSALATWERRGEPDERGEAYRLPADPRPEHALLRPPVAPPGTRRPVLLDDTRKWAGVLSRHPIFLEAHLGLRAAYGLNVLVVLPVQFDAADLDDCPGCAQEVTAWSEDPASWWLTRETLWRAQARRRGEDRNVTDWRARADPRR